jgi:hypothetical protein
MPSDLQQIIPIACDLVSCIHRRTLSYSDAFIAASQFKRKKYARYIFPDNCFYPLPFGRTNVLSDSVRTCFHFALASATSSRTTCVLKTSYVLLSVVQFILVLPACSISRCDAFNSLRRGHVLLQPSPIHHFCRLWLLTLLLVFLNAGHVGSLPLTRRSLQT